MQDTEKGEGGRSCPDPLPLELLPRTLRTRRGREGGGLRATAQHSTAWHGLALHPSPTARSFERDKHPEAKRAEQEKKEASRLFPRTHLNWPSAPKDKKEGRGALT